MIKTNQPPRNPGRFTVPKRLSFDWSESGAEKFPDIHVCKRLVKGRLRVCEKSAKRSIVTLLRRLHRYDQAQAQGDSGRKLSDSLTQDVWQIILCQKEAWSADSVQA